MYTVLDSSAKIKQLEVIVIRDTAGKRPSYVPFVTYEPQSSLNFVILLISFSSIGSLISPEKIFLI